MPSDPVQASNLAQLHSVASKSTGETCIYCLSTDLHSKEHSLPKGLGRFKNQKTLLKRICKACNNKIGHLDEQFCAVGPTGFLRFVAGVGDPKYLYRGSHNVRPIQMVGRLQGCEYDVLWEVGPGVPEARMMRQIVFRSGQDYIPIQINERLKTPQDLSAFLADRGYSTLEPIMLIYSDGEESWMTSLIKPFIKSALLIKETPRVKPSQLTLSVSAYYSTDFFREIAKIAFHHTLEIVEYIRGDENEFAAIKDFIMGKRDDYPTFVKKREQFDFFHRSGARPSKWCHYLLLNANRWEIEVLCQFFVGPEYLSPCYVVSVGANPLRTIVNPIQVAHQFTYLGKTSPEGFAGEMHRALSVTQIR